MPGARRTTVAVVLVAMAVSVVHYVDNYTAYEAYPQSDTLPNPSAGLIGFAWFFFTAFALAGLWLLRRGDDRLAAVCLAVFSGSGLVGLGHYSVGGTGEFPWWRHAHIVTDIVLGFCVLGCALWLVRGSRVSASPPYGEA